MIGVSSDTISLRLLPEVTAKQPVGFVHRKTGCVRFLDISIYPNEMADAAALYANIRPSRNQTAFFTVKAPNVIVHG